MRKYSVLISILLYTGLIPVNTSGQSNSSLAIGDKIPDLYLKNVINYKDTAFYLSKFKGKFIILDFWNQNCLTCIKSFPKIDSLQKENSNQIQFLLVNQESKISTINFFNKRPQINMPNVPLITNDSILRKKFPIKGYPYSIWIDQNFVVRYITSGYNITSEHIQSFMKSQLLDVNDISIKRSRGSLFEHSDKSVISKIRYYSYISSCIPNIHVGFNDLIKVSDSTIKISSNCSSIIELLQLAYRESDDDKYRLPNTIVLKVKEPENYQRPVDKNQMDAWVRHNTYNYDLVLPLKMKQKGYQLMQEDLSRYFGLKVIRKRKFINGYKTEILIIREKES